MKRASAFILFAVLCCMPCLAADLAAPKQDFSGKPTFAVVRVVDGDTVVLSVNGKDETVRLIGVDTPETKDPRKPVQAYGKEASAFTANLLKGETVYAISDPQGDSRDKYGRALAYVYRAPDGFFINMELIRQGYAHAYTQFPFSHMDLFRQTEAFARESENGLWGPEGQTAETALNEAPSMQAIATPVVSSVAPMSMVPAMMQAAPNAAPVGGTV